MSRPVIDLTGRTFGEWTVLHRSAAIHPDRHARWYCRCACGYETVVVGHSLRHGRSKSCFMCSHRRRIKPKPA